MKSHDLANALQTLARLLKAAPDAELSELTVTTSKSLRSSQEIAVNLDTLISLSTIDKSKWAELIADYGFPIEIRPRDASRDVLGKLFSYLEQNPLAREKLKANPNRESGKASPELLRALNTLLKGTHESS